MKANDEELAQFWGTSVEELLTASKYMGQMHYTGVLLLSLSMMPAG